MNVRERIEARLDELASSLKLQEHIHDPELVTNKLDAVAKFWSALDQGDREFCGAARNAIAKRIPWLP